MTLWWGDERCVPPEDERSNYRLAKENLLDRLRELPGEIHRIRGELAPPEAADELDRALDGAHLDLILLGLGPDGHMASLFPALPQLHVQDRRATYGPSGLDPRVDRVTMTVPTITSAARSSSSSAAATRPTPCHGPSRVLSLTTCPRASPARRPSGRGLPR